MGTQTHWHTQTIFFWIEQICYEQKLEVTQVTVVTHTGTYTAIRNCRQNLSNYRTVLPLVVVVVNHG
jgi:hypothetical protein